MPANKKCRYQISWVQEEERRARVVKAEKKSWMQQGLNL
jgi:hypothetical protein